MTPPLSAPACQAITGARQYHQHIVLNCPGEVAQELLAARLVDAGWLMDAGGRTAWALTGEGRAVHDELVPPDPVVRARAARVASAWLHDVSSGVHGQPL